MAISEAAQRNHDAVFPNRRSMLKETDPELVELTHLLPFIGYPRTLDALRVINEGTSP